MMIRMLFLSLLTIQALQANASLLKCDREVNTEISNKETLLKTFVGDYWQAMQSEISKLPNDLQKKGFVVGDFHFNNVGVYFDYVKNTAVLTMNDFDDAGTNYLLGDLIKYMAYIRRIDKKFDSQALVANYIAGLKGQVTAMPAQLTALINRQAYYFGQEQVKLVDSKGLEADDFDLNSLTAKQKTTLAQFMGLNLIKRLKSVKAMLSVNATGSSQGMERYEFIGTDANGAIGVIEFKELKCSGSGPSDQQDMVNSFKQVKGFLQTHFYSNYRASQQIYEYNSNFYLVREKKYNALKKLALETLDAGHIQVYVNYFANYLGQIHSKTSDAQYVAAVTKYHKQIYPLSEKISKQFTKDIR